ncbi:hypothetical protein [Clostridium lundense]|uniref:hypothetical protein n=1 Tax=Clostridium lundense TaxID=319475 RepID=UPI000483B52A|nr:hypothetical protein [Clostridium lundense]
MCYYELKITLNLKKDLYYDNVTEKLSFMMNKSMLCNEYLKNIHEVNMYKLYVFEGLSPFEKDKVYKCGRYYMTRLRCVDQFMAESFRECLKGTKTNEFDVLAVDIDIIEAGFIKKLFNVTPAILTVDNGPWIEGMDIDILKNCINNNLLKKLKLIEGIDEELNHDMIKSIKLKNRSPIGCKYKGIKLIGNKFDIEVKEDGKSQLMARIALSTGILEKNSLGYGYCLYKND